MGIYANFMENDGVANIVLWAIKNNAIDARAMITLQTTGIVINDVKKIPATRGTKMCNKGVLLITSC